MTKLVLLGAVLTGCTTDTKNLERKIDALTAEVKAMRSGGGAVGGGGPARGERPQPPQPNPAKTYAMTIDGDPFEGPADAKITIVKSYDYACPFCEGVRPTIAKIVEKYGSDVRIVSKVNVIHPDNAMAGGLAFCAAAKQGKAKEMEALIWDKGFLTKPRKGGNLDISVVKDGDKQANCWDTAGGCANVVGYANELGLDVERFKADMREGSACHEQIKRTTSPLRAMGTTGTPALYVNGRYIPGGAAPFERIAPVIDEELQKANDAIGKGLATQADYYEKIVVGQGLKKLDG